MNANRRNAFTLVELLVVVAIIAMLMALLLPAVNAARESGRATTCRNNLKNVSLAVIQYDTAHGRYPFIHNHSSNGSRRPLLFALLPHLERNDYFELYSPASYAADDLPSIHLAVTACPSDPRPQGSAVSSFVYNIGYGYQSTDAPAGVFGVSSLNPGGGTSSSFVGAGDGISNTVMASENLDAGHWTDLNELYVGFLWAPFAKHDEIANFYRINAPNKGTGQGPTARPSSNHPATCNFAFCDGHVRAIHEGIAYHVFAQLMTSSGRRVQYPLWPDSPDRYFSNASLRPTHYLLDDEDYN